MPTTKSSPSPPLLVFHARTGGLANRLRALVGYQALSRCLGMRFGLAWKVDRWCDAAYSELFEGSDLELISARAELGLPDDVEVYDESIWFDAIWQNWGRGRVEWPDFASQVRRCLDGLTPVAEIAAEVDRFSAEHALETMTGIHIRHTDNLQAYETSATRKSGVFDRSRVSTLEGFANAMERGKATRSFFLATDDPDVERMLADRFGGTLTLFQKRYRRVDGARLMRTTSVQSALVELLLLARCREIIGTYYSSYGKFAAILGGGDYHEIRGHRCARNRGIDRAQISLGTGRFPLAWWRRPFLGFAPPL